jgi:hypothetical protein
LREVLIPARARVTLALPAFVRINDSNPSETIMH